MEFPVDMIRTYQLLVIATRCTCSLKTTWSMQSFKLKKQKSPVRAGKALSLKEKGLVGACKASNSKEKDPIATTNATSPTKSTSLTSTT